MGEDRSGPDLEWAMQELPTAGPPEPAAGGPEVLASGARIGDYRVRRLLGEGAMGQVYLAQDLTLGRRVALKLLKTSAVAGDALARFLEEARATARFNHPHIVTLHAVGEHHGRPYLALEYLDGESLRARLAAGPLPQAEALACCRAVAEAIAEAHRRGMVHADLKPENIVIPRDGRVRVVDFGLARLAGGDAAVASTVSGTPAYMAPERWRGAPTTGAIDVWAIGVILHELMTGRRPLADAALEQLPFAREPLALPALPDAPWAALAQDCLALAPAARPTAEEVARRLGELVAPATAARCPFPGLAALTRDHAGVLGAGRRARADALAEQLRARALVCVVGPAGAGKSSLVGAGLLPRLEAAGGWTVCALRPGARPFPALAAALAPPAGDGGADALADALRRDPAALPRALAGAARRHGGRVLLLVDPLDELFARAPAGEARALCDGLGAAAADPAAPWRVVLVLRDGALDRLAAAPALRPHLGAVTRLPPPSAAELRAAAVEPLAAAGYAPDEPGLAARLVADVEGQPGGLALLQLTCQALWERRDARARRVLLAEYEAMGGAAGALAAHARRVEAELPPAEAAALRPLLLALFRADGDRRPRGPSELLAQVPAPARDAAGRALGRLLERRVLVETSPAGALELAHRGLAAAWPRLARWLDDTHGSRGALDALEDAALAWHRGGRRPADTWRGRALAGLARKLEDGHLAPSALGRAFLAASLRRARRARARRRWLAAALAAGAAVALALALALAR